MPGPHPTTRLPLNGEPHTVFLKNVISRPTIKVGDFTYYNDDDNASDFENRNVLYHFDFIGDELVIGKFCALATGTQFIMNGATHALGGFSTYPFNIFGHGWEEGVDFSTFTSSQKGDTVVGNDVWIGRGATIMPGVSIGSGAIIGAYAVVTKDVPPYCIAAGNPAQVMKKRFCDKTIERLLDIAWWDWPIDKISRNLAAIRGADLAALENAV
ncbi:CatB-related O-acetyltransferase [Pseudovibrio sp. SPO723]|uniref:CatB-related O-acetyltransferase n=1 Tax=Nesiotobacter zosterae TaxID=392721 RepID=UPI0029C22684|nr:CatB-related O-acetyltransferase [Pseudovibrio sp. SPO723]MDX5592396.1 CatB-related O-acetyltransferase [Pseudovibrio sp. SPO723]